MNTPQSPISHIVPAKCREYDPLYFQDENGVGYNFVILFELIQPERIYMPQIQVGQFHLFPPNTRVITLKKEGDGHIEFLNIDSLKYLRVDEFVTVRRCISTYPDDKTLMQRAVSNPIAASVYDWMRTAQYELHMFGDDFFDILKVAIRDIDLKSLYRSPWIK